MKIEYVQTRHDVASDLIVGTALFGTPAMLKSLPRAEVVRLVNQTLADLKRCLYAQIGQEAPE